MKSYYSLFLIILVLLGCQEHESLTTSDEREIHVVDGRLVFKDFDQFLNTFSGIGNGTVELKDGKLSGFDYDSYYNSSAHSAVLNDQIDNAIDIYEYQILLNKKREIQIGDEVYLINDDETIMHNISTDVVTKEANEVGYYDRNTKSFDKKSNGREFGVWYHEVRENIDPNTNQVIQFSFVRVKTIFINYLYKANHRVPSVLAPTSKVEYFYREISDCDGCTIQPSDPYGGYKRDVSNVTYSCGGHINAAEEAANGINLRAVYRVKPYGYTVELKYTHYLCCF